MKEYLDEISKFYELREKYIFTNSIKKKDCEKENSLLNKISNSISLLEKKEVLEKNNLKEEHILLIAAELYKETRNFEYKNMVSNLVKSERKIISIDASNFIDVIFPSIEIR